MNCRIIKLMTNPTPRAMQDTISIVTVTLFKKTQRNSPIGLARAVVVRFRLLKS